MAFDIDNIDEVIHGRLRLGVMAYLVGAGTGDFVTIKQHLKTSDGNLSIHLRKLEEAGYVTIEKSFVDRKPRTEIAVTSLGRKAFVKYLDSLSPLINRK
jgi:DNA-binding MarR family transcriptional regulator